MAAECLGNRGDGFVTLKEGGDDGSVFDGEGVSLFGGVGGHCGCAFMLACCLLEMTLPATNAFDSLLVTLFYFKATPKHFRDNLENSAVFAARRGFGVAEVVADFPARLRADNFNVVAARR